MEKWNPWHIKVHRSHLIPTGILTGKVQSLLSYHSYRLVLTDKTHNNSCTQKNKWSTMVPKMTHRGTPPLYEIPQNCKQHRGDNQQYCTHQTN